MPHKETEQDKKYHFEFWRLKGLELMDPKDFVEEDDFFEAELDLAMKHKVPVRQTQADKVIKWLYDSLGDWTARYFDSERQAIDLIATRNKEIEMLRGNIANLQQENGESFEKRTQLGKRVQELQRDYWNLLIAFVLVLLLLSLAGAGIIF